MTPGRTQDNSENAYPPINDFQLVHEDLHEAIADNSQAQAEGLSSLMSDLSLSAANSQAQSDDAMQDCQQAQDSTFISHTACAPATCASSAADPGGHDESAPLPGVEAALAYLDEVKAQFPNDREVYEEFLAIMRLFKDEQLDTPGVLERVSTLFAEHPRLIQGFWAFMPPGYPESLESMDDGCCQ